MVLFVWLFEVLYAKGLSLVRAATFIACLQKKSWRRGKKKMFFNELHFNKHPLTTALPLFTLWRKPRNPTRAPETTPRHNCITNKSLHGGIFCAETLPLLKFLHVAPFSGKNGEFYYTLWKYHKQASKSNSKVPSLMSPTNDRLKEKSRSFYKQTILTVGRFRLLPLFSTQCFKGRVGPTAWPVGPRWVPKWGAGRAADGGIFCWVAA